MYHAVPKISHLFTSLHFLSLKTSQPSSSDDSTTPIAMRTQLEAVHLLLHHSLSIFLPFPWPPNVPQPNGRPGCSLSQFRFPKLNERPQTPSWASCGACQAKIYPHGRESIQIIRTGHSELQEEIQQGATTRIRWVVSCRCRIECYDNRRLRYCHDFVGTVLGHLCTRAASESARGNISRAL